MESKTMPLLLIGGAAVVAAVALTGGPPALRQAMTGKGKRMGRVTVTKAPAGPDGLVAADPNALAKQAGTSLDVYALARMIASEHPSGTNAVKVAVACVVLNYARKRGVSVSALLLAPQGRFGRQNVGKYAATGNDPTAEEIEIARRVLSGGVLDPTGGAVQFDSPRAQRAALARGVKGYKKTPEDVARQRIAEGKVAVTVPGIDPDYLRFWKPVPTIATVKPTRKPTA
jgi:spore germination cell wall hydrolase CwlJ-like protein